MQLTEFSHYWTPVTGEILLCSHERNNVHNRYAIAAEKRFAGRLDSAVVDIFQGKFLVPRGF